MLVFVFAFVYSCKVVNLALFRCGVCPVASESTVYLLCIALLLLPAHVCLGFWDRSPGPTDHTCGERELGTRTSSSMAKKKKKEEKKKNKKLESTVDSETSAKNERFWHTNVHNSMQHETDMRVHKVARINKSSAFEIISHTVEVMPYFSHFQLYIRLSRATYLSPTEPFPVEINPTINYSSNDWCFISLFFKRNRYLFACWKWERAKESWQSERDGGAEKMSEIGEGGVCECRSWNLTHKLALLPLSLGLLYLAST